MTEKQIKQNGYWKEKDNIINFIVELAASKGFNCYEDYYRLTRKDFEDNGGSSLLMKFYNGSIHDVVACAINNHQWLPWLFNRCNVGFWSSTKNQRWFLDWLATKLGFTCPEDYYSLTTQIVLQHRGSGLLKQYRDSVSLAVSTLFPEITDWRPWLFSKTPNAFWKNRQNCRDYFDWYVNSRGPDFDIYQITGSDVRANYGGGLIANHHCDSISDAIQFAYPELIIDPTKFRSTPQRYWADPKNRKAFFDSIMPKLGINILDDWYRISREQVIDLGGGGLLVTQYSSSLLAALADIYPNHDWVPWKFRKVPSGYWQSWDNRKQFFHHLKEMLRIDTQDEWYGITKEEIHLYGGGGLLSGFYRDSPSLAISDIFPEYNWDHDKFYATGKSQGRLLSALRAIFPDKEYKYNFKGSGLKFNVSASTVVELDIYFPQVKLAFEYQGQQHYHAMKFWHGEEGLITQIRRDEEKRILCKCAGISLIEIPYWCDLSAETIASIIFETRPELFQGATNGRLPHRPEEVLSNDEIKLQLSVRKRLRTELNGVDRQKLEANLLPVSQSKIACHQRNRVLICRQTWDHHAEDAGNLVGRPKSGMNIRKGANQHK